VSICGQKKQSMNTNSPIILALALLANASAANAQHEISLYGGGGLNALQSTYAQGTSSGRAGASFGAAYAYLFTPTWGIAAGAEVSFFGSTFTATSLHGEAQQTYTGSSFSERMTFLSDFAGYEETHHASYLRIPILAQYRLPAFDEIGSLGASTFFAAAGFKLGFALGGSYEATASSLTTYVEMADSEQTLQDMLNHGLGLYPNPAYSGDLDLALDLSLSLEAGISVALNDRWSAAVNGQWSAAISAYLDYGLLNLAPTAAAPLLTLNTSSSATNHTRFAHNSIAASADKISLLAVGVRVRVCWGSKAKSEE
jgi:hypothetical protein